MKGFKGMAAMAMAATLLAGSVMTVAADEGGGTGTGDYEGYIEETSVFSVVVPTDATGTAGFNFFVDPNGLLAATDYARISGATAADFEANASLFFTRTVAGDGSAKYGKTSDAIKLENRSSYAVNVEVTATISGATGIALAETEAAITDETTDPTIYLAIVSGAETKAITSEGGKFEGTIDGEDDNFEIKYDTANSKYVYDLVGTTTYEAPTKAWKTVSFSLTGACGGKWTADQADVTPTVTLTWKVTDPKAAPSEVSITSGATAVVAGSADESAGVTHTATLVKGANTEITIGLPTGNTIKKVYVAGSTTGLSGNTENADRAAISGNKVVLKGDSDWANGGAGVKYAKIVVGTEDETTKEYIIKISVN